MITEQNRERRLKIQRDIVIKGQIDAMIECTLLHWASCGNVNTPLLEMNRDYDDDVIRTQ